MWIFLNNQPGVIHSLSCLAKVKFVMRNNAISDRGQSNAVGCATGWMVVRSPGLGTTSYESINKQGARQTAMSREAHVQTYGTLTGQQARHPRICFGLGGHSHASSAMRREGHCCECNKSDFKNETAIDTERF